MSKTLNVRIILDNRTHTAFEAANPILLKGEIGIETDTPYYRIGNGIDTWDRLKVYSRIDSEQKNNLDTIIEMMNGEGFGKVDDVLVNEESVVENKIAKISIGNLTFSDQGQEPVGEESFKGSITLHKFAKTGLELIDDLNSTSTKAALTANAGNKLREMIQNIERSKTYSTIQEMVEAVNAYDNTTFYPGLNLWIVATGVPDFWIASVEETSVPYEYSSDSSLIDQLTQDGTIQIGFYKIALLETRKVDLTDYYKGSKVDELIDELEQKITALSTRIKTIEDDETIVRSTDVLILDGGSGLEG